MPELTKLNDCDTEGDYIVVYGDSGTDDPCLSIVGRAAGVSTDVILDRTAGARLVVALDAWLQDTAKDRAELASHGFTVARSGYGVHGVKEVEAGA